MAILEVKNIEKHFGSTKVLKDISFDLEEGQALANYRFFRFRKDNFAQMPEFFGDADQRYHYRER